MSGKKLRPDSAPVFTSLPSNVNRSASVGLLVSRRNKYIKVSGGHHLRARLLPSLTLLDQRPLARRRRTLGLTR